MMSEGLTHNLGLTGFQAEELEDLFAELEASRPFELPKELEPAEALGSLERPKSSGRVKEAELWQLGRHRLLCGDSLRGGNLARLCAGREVPLVLTDPPYGIDYESRLTRPETRKAPIANDGSAEFDSFLQQALPLIRAAMAPGATLYWFAGGGGAKPALAQALFAISRHLDLQNCLVWDKETPGLGWRWRRSWEAIIEASRPGKPPAWYGGSHRRNLLRFLKLIPQAEDHPTPKPIGLLAELIRVSSRSGEVVLDPFAGSGSTLIAAQLAGRSCYAAELEPGYCELILERWESLTGQQANREASNEQ